MAVALYQIIVEQLKYKIAQGEYKEYDKLPTEIELAEQYKVSRITSKKALDTLAAEGLIIRQRRVGSYVAPHSEGTKKGARPGEGEHGEKSNNLIAILLPIDSGQSNFSEFIQGSLAALENTPYHLVVHNSRKNPNDEKYYIHSLLNNGVKGLVLYPVSDKHNFDVLSSLYWNHVPLVTIDKRYSDIPIPSVVSDNLEASRRITEYLIRKGHRRIVFFSEVPIDMASSLRERFMGYCRALSENGIPVDNRLVFDAVDFGSGDTVKEALLKRLENIVRMEATAVQCAADGVAIWLMRACKASGIRVPRDLSIVGFDDLPDAALPDINLTTMRQDNCKIGEMATNILLDQINGKTITQRESICHTAFIERGSVLDLGHA